MTVHLDQITDGLIQSMIDNTTLDVVVETSDCASHPDYETIERQACDLISSLTVASVRAALETKYIHGENAPQEVIGAIDMLCTPVDAPEGVCVTVPHDGEVALDGLCAWLNEKSADADGLDALPTFGGEDILDTTEVWSWDAKRAIVGPFGGEPTYRIVDRCSHCGEVHGTATVHNMSEDGVHQTAITIDGQTYRIDVAVATAHSYDIDWDVCPTGVNGIAIDDYWGVAFETAYDNAIDWARKHLPEGFSERDLDILSGAVELSLTECEDETSPSKWSTTDNQTAYRSDAATEISNDIHKLLQEMWEDSDHDYRFVAEVLITKG